MADEPKPTGFIDTADPNVLTIGDFYRWCDELAQFVRDNPTGEGWAAKAETLYHRLKMGEEILRSLREKGKWPPNGQETRPRDKEG